MTPGFLGANVAPVARCAAASTWIANLRGGGEFGEDWHRQGALTHKQNVFDDFLAVGRST